MVFRSAGRGSTTSLRLGFGRCLVMQTCPRVGLVSAFCSCPPSFALGFLHPRPHGRKLALGYLVPPNRPIGDLHSRPNVMSHVHEKGDVHSHVPHNPVYSRLSHLWYQVHNSMSHGNDRSTCIAKSSLNPVYSRRTELWYQIRRVRLTSHRSKLRESCSSSEARADTTPVRP